MNFEDLTRTLSAMERLLDSRVEVWRVIFDRNKKELRRVYRGVAFVKNRDSRREPHSQEDRR